MSTETMAFCVRRRKHLLLPPPLRSSLVVFDLLNRQLTYEQVHAPPQVCFLLSNGYSHAMFVSHSGSKLSLNPSKNILDKKLLQNTLKKMFFFENALHKTIANLGIVCVMVCLPKNLRPDCVKLCNVLQNSGSENQ